MLSLWETKLESSNKRLIASDARLKNGKPTPRMDWLGVIAANHGVHMNASELIAPEPAEEHLLARLVYRIKALQVATVYQLKKHVAYDLGAEFAKYADATRS
jgi:hypothetical protein